jgi:hypothetical protein
VARETPLESRSRQARKERGPTPDELAEEALSAEQETARVRAAVQLSTQKAATQLRDVVVQTRDPEVRATAAQALGDLADFGSVPELFCGCATIRRPWYEDAPVRRCVVSWAPTFRLRRRCRLPSDRK